LSVELSSHSFYHVFLSDVTVIEI